MTWPLKHIILKTAALEFCHVKSKLELVGAGRFVIRCCL